MPEQVTSCSRDLYDAPRTSPLDRGSVVELDLVPNTSMRAPGEAIGTFALESAIDELANELGIDPIELRLRNEPAPAPDRRPRRFSHHGVGEALRRGAELFGWPDRDPRPGSMRDGPGRWSAWGWPRPSTRRWQFTANVTVRLAADGGVLVRCGVPRDGHGHGDRGRRRWPPTRSASPVERVRVEYGDTDAADRAGRRRVRPDREHRRRRGPGGGRAARRRCCGWSAGNRTRRCAGPGARPSGCATAGCTARPAAGS